MDTKIILSATWVVVVLIFLYGDVLRICSGDLSRKPMADKNLNQFVWLGIAFLMLTPILMVFLTLVLPQSVSRGAGYLPKYSAGTRINRFSLNGRLHTGHFWKTYRSVLTITNSIADAFAELRLGLSTRYLGPMYN